MVSESATTTFRSSLRGQSFASGEPGYDAARVVFNRVIDRHPALIARCAGAADVMACVRFASEHGLTVSVRGGGHSIAGKAICDDGLMIDLSGMKGIRVDPASRTVRAEPGLTIGEFDRETQAFGLATTMGVISTTGIAGLTLGGGMGWLIGKHGLACDNVTAMDVVTADGRLVTASKRDNEDLFWGIRGGGGNFGIVTSFEYRLHEVGPVLGGGVLYPVDKARDVLHFYRDFAATSPDELSTQIGRLTTLDGIPVIGVAGCYCGSLAKGEKALAPLRGFGAPIADLFGPISYVQMQSMFDPWFPPGRQAYWKANFLHGLPDEAIDVFCEFALTVPSPFTTGPWLEHLHGAVSRVGPTDTAFAHRRHPYNFLVLSSWDDPSEAQRNIQWTRACWDAMRPFMVAGAYVNYLEEEADPLARSAYGPNYDRLVALKNKYDPTNLFHINHNIGPTRPAPTP
jgi:FAD/FMN-containing dehydrogenase